MKRVTLKEIKELVKGFSIEKVSDDLIDKVLHSASFDDLFKKFKDEAAGIMLFAAALEMNRLNRNYLTEKEILEAAERLYLDIVIEGLRREGIIERKSWAWKEDYEMTLTEKGKKEAMEILKRLENESKRA